MANSLKFQTLQTRLIFYAILVSLIIFIALVTLTLIPSDDFDYCLKLSARSVYDDPGRLYSSRDWGDEIGNVSANLRPFSYATLLPSTFHVPAFEVFIYTFARVENSYPLIVLIPSEFEGTELHSKILYIMKKYEKISLEYHIYFCPIANFNPSKTEKKRNRKYYTDLLRDSYIKFQLWTLLDLSSVFFVSIDSIFLHNTDDIFSLELPVQNQLFAVLEEKEKRFNGSSSAQIQAKRAGIVFEWKKIVANADGKEIRYSSNSISDVFLLRPSMETYHWLIDEAKRIREADGKGYLLRAVKHRFTHGSTKDLFSEIFSREEFSRVGCLPSRYHSTKRSTIGALIKDWWPNQENSGNNVKQYSILQFDGEAPWSTWSSTTFRSKFVPADYVKRRQLEGRWDADSYMDLHEIWRSLYLKAREKEYTNIAIFQTYHTVDCCPYLERSNPSYRHVRLSGSLCELSDIDAVEFVPELSDQAFQLTLGEFGAMMAVDRLLLGIDTAINVSFHPSNLPSKSLQALSMVGFTSWRAYQKADFKHGASLDWTKLDLQSSLHGESIYFWYGYYSERDFYQTTESYHPGMTKVIQSCTSFKLPRMGPGYYFYSNYFITSRETFLRYMTSAKALVQCFLEKYGSGQKCPFLVPEEEEKIGGGKVSEGVRIGSGLVHKNAGRSRCLGYLLERYINIWAVHSGARSVFAVDHPAWRRRQRKTFFSSLF